MTSFKDTVRSKNLKNLRHSMFSSLVLSTADASSRHQTIGSSRVESNRIGMDRIESNRSG